MANKEYTQKAHEAVFEGQKLAAQRKLAQYEPEALLSALVTQADGVVPHNVKYAFYAGAAVLFLAVGWTVVSTREYAPEQLRSFDDFPQEQARLLEALVAANEVRDGLSTVAELWPGKRSEHPDQVPA